MKNVKLGITLVVVGLLAAGGAVGWYAGYRTAMTRAWLGEFAVSASVAQRGQVLFADGDDDAAEEALNSYLTFLADVESRGGGERLDIFWLNRRGLAYDRMLTYARLALVAERRQTGNMATADDLWRRAGVAGAAAGIKDTSPAGLRSLVERASAATAQPR